MKTFHKIQVIEEPSSRLYIDESIAQIAGLQKDVILNAMALVPIDESTKNSLTPDISIISSHFPVGSWANLFRASFTIKPGKGSLSKLITALNGIGLLVRFIESTDGINLNDYTIRVGSKPDHQKINLLDNTNLSPLIIPSSLLVLEIPEKTNEFFKEIKPNLNEGTMKKISHLHSQIKKIISGESSDVSAVRIKLEKILQGENSRLDISIDWLSTMTCLNRLGNLNSFKARPRNTESHNSSNTDTIDQQSMRDFSLMFRTRARKKIHIQLEEGKLFIDATAWRSIFWHGSEHIPDERKITKPPQLLSISFTDSNEKITCWNLFRETSVIVIEFRVISPARGLEHVWWEWILDLS